MSQGKIFILMGISSTGKSTIGKVVARQLGIKFIDGDDLHPRANIIKMQNGISLDDQDRIPWLARINDAVFSLQHKNESGIIVCSALKKTYRDQIRHANQPIHFLFLHGEFDVILARMQTRQGHFMKAGMLKSQFETLEVPQAEENDVVFIDISHNFKQVVAQCIQAIQRA